MALPDCSHYLNAAPSGQESLLRCSNASSDAYNLNEEVRILYPYFNVIWFAYLFRLGICKIPSVPTWSLHSHSPGSLRIARVSTQQRVANASTIQRWLERTGITVLHLGFQYHCSWDVVVVDGPWRQALPTDCTIETINPKEPSEFERDNYGPVGSAKKASERFLKNALDAIFHAVDDRASRYYCIIAEQNCLRTELKMMVFCAEFEVNLSSFLSDFLLTVYRNLPLRLKCLSLRMPSSSVSICSEKLILLLLMNFSNETMQIGTNTF